MKSVLEQFKALSNGNTAKAQNDRVKAIIDLYNKGRKVAKHVQR